ncbi:MAG: MOSC domain-containing protein [Candidatus Dormibacteraeota bacterium]|uniref:MOSC domain-containing protein n=1 Tax=Candidatus Amunia macphersoniae TaxID=3127014 RepID=A0A934NGS8_9BACT|nr:MOSC domain-containing protein [Candidatus Dormibacteraeota bacterium]
MTGATVAWLSIAPVKGLRVQELGALHLDRHGARGDRRFVITDGACHLVNGKRLPSLVQVVAEATESLLSLRFPDGTVVSAEPRLGEPATLIAYGHPRPVRTVLGPWATALSEFAGMALRVVQPLDPGDGVDRRRDAGVSLLSTASLDSLAASAGVDSVDPRRFRMTIGIAGIDAFEEERWLGQTLRVGPATLRVGGNVGRCAVTTLDPDGGAVDLPTLHLLRGLREHVAATEPLPFGVWGEVVEPGLVQVGDEILA